MRAAVRIKPANWLILLGAVSLLVLLATPFVGMQTITPAALWSAEQKFIKLGF